MIRFLTALTVCLICTMSWAQEPFMHSKGYSAGSSHTALVIPRPESSKDPRNQYVLALLKLALEETEGKYGPWSIAFSVSPEVKTQSEILEELLGGLSTLNITWVMTDKRKEQLLLPVRVPIHKGVIGYRVCLLPPRQTSALEGIKTLRDLVSSNITVGQGSDWPDTKILSHNGLEVVTSEDYEILFEMLEKKRFNCFLRGLNEVFMELSIRPQFELDRNLVVYYPSPAYFFVRQQDQKLHQRLTEGLNNAIQNGSFDRLFARFHDETIHKVRLDKRTLIQLKNPLLSQETPLDNDKLWYRP